MYGWFSGTHKQKRERNEADKERLSERDWPPHTYDLFPKSGSPDV